MKANCSLRSWLISAAGVVIASASLAGVYVADPFRAVDVKWPKHFCKGQDYRFLLYRGFLDLEDDPFLKDEPFMKEAGIADLTFNEKSEGGGRVIELKEIVCRDASGQVVDAKAKVTSPDAGAIVETYGKGMVVSAPRWDAYVRHLPVRAKVELTAPTPIASVTLESPDLPSDQLERKIAAPATTVSFDIASKPTRYYFERPNWGAKIEARIKDRPFSLTEAHRGNFGLPPSQIDTSAYAKLCEEYPETYLGCDFGEWDAMFLYRLARPQSDRMKELARLGKFPCNREEMVLNLKKFWELGRSQMGPRVYGQCAAGLESYTCEWGASISSTETTDNREKPFRNMMMRIRGASRQFDKPVYIYTAYFRGSHTCDSRPERNKSTQGRWGEDFGREPSLSLREHFMTYYMGCNYQSFECQPWGQVKKLPDGTLAYTKNGLAMKAIYDWYKSPKGDRGESYAPILLLTDRIAEHDVLDWVHVSEARNQGVWKGAFPPTDADFLEEYVMQAITPYYDPFKFSIWKMTPDFSANMRNSTLADIFDVYNATPLDRKQEPTLAQLAKYPVIFLMHDIHWTETLANTVKRYVAEGGTLVLTTAQTAPFADDPEFLGISSRGCRTADGNLLVERVALAGGEVVEKTAGGLPLLVKKTFGAGHVLLVTSPFFRQVKDRDTVPPQLVKLLERLQAETVPVKVEGLCEALYNVCADGSWRVTLINNSGVQKDPGTSDDPKRPEWAAKLVVTLPKGATATEIRTGAKLEPLGGDRYAITVTAGEVCVLKVDGIRGLGAKAVAKTEVRPVTPFGVIPYVPQTPNDGYKFGDDNPPPTPEVIGRWRAADGMKDSSPQGHDMKFVNGAHMENGLFVTGKDLAYGEVRFDEEYPIPEATYDMYVTPSEKDLDVYQGVFAKESHCGVSDTVRVEIKNGRWNLFKYVEGRDREERVGPKAEPRRTRLTVTLKNGFCRLYVDGEEVRHPRGPVKLSSSAEARDNFYKNVYILFGASSIHKGFYFRGTCESLTFTSKAIVPTGK